MNPSASQSATNTHGQLKQLFSLKRRLESLTLQRSRGFSSLTSGESAEKRLKCFEAALRNQSVSFQWGQKQKVNAACTPLITSEEDKEVEEATAANGD